MQILVIIPLLLPDSGYIFKLYRICAQFRFGRCAGGFGLAFFSYLKLLRSLFFGLFFGLSFALPAMGNTSELVEPAILPSIAGLTESSIEDISIIFPVTKNNYAAVIAGLHKSEALRELTTDESNTLMSSVPSGTYYFAYGFQLMTAQDSADFLVSRVRGTDWHHFELHKRSDGEIVLLGYATSKDLEKFDYYSKTYGPTPQLLPLPTENHNVLLILPLRLIGKIITQDLQLDVGGVTALEAALLPKK